MTRMPGAIWKPLPGSSTTPLDAYDIFCVHTMVGSLTGTDTYFRSRADGTNSHFGVGYDGTIYQWVDTAYRSGANYTGNHHIVSVETADTGTGFPAWTGSDVPAWTPAQLTAIAKIAAWVNATHGIPLTQIPDSKPGRRGIGYHRLGIDPWRVSGGELWSTTTGKVCPGDRRMSQVPQVISLASTSGGFLMALTDDEQRRVLKFCDDWAYLMPTVKNSTDQIPGVASNVASLIGDASDGTDRLGDLWNSQAEIKGIVAGLAAATTDGGLTVDQVCDAAAAGATKALGDVQAAITAAVTAALGEGNAELAAAIVTEIKNRL